MAQVITSATHKGGEGKTTLSISIAEYLAIIKNKKVLLIDLDPQVNLSSRYLKMDVDPNKTAGRMPPIHPDSEDEIEERSSIADLFFGKPVYPYPTRFKNIEIIPGSVELEEIRASFDNSKWKKVSSTLKNFLEIEELDKEYDFVVIDTPPSKCPLTRSAISCTDFLIFPTKMEKFSMDGIYGMMQLYSIEKSERSESNPINLLGIVPNMFRKTKLHEENLQLLMSHNPLARHVLPHKLKLRSKYPELLNENAEPSSVFELSSKDAVRKETEDLCSACYDRINSFVNKEQGVEV
ncbi:MAG: ParA family protein [Francisellaceae bacterium]|nr:ParA family protein [Francisellaceae bacterium]